MIVLFDFIACELCNYFNLLCNTFIFKITQFCYTKKYKVMENRYAKYLQLPFEEKHLDASLLNENTSKLGGKWLPYLLICTAIILWVVFNIVAIESYEFFLYPLVVMNLILYFVIAIMINPDHYSDS